MRSVFLLGLIGILVFLVACAPSEQQCTEDSDCVPAACCHATGAINQENAPDCSGTLCTMNCEPETLDCGQGEIQCISGSCEAVFE